MKKPVRILIVEDRLDDANLAKREILRILSGCEFLITETRDDFIEALETFQPDVILSDYILPRFNGMEALQLTLHHTPLTPLIIWTGSISEDVAVDCVKAGAHNYILKDNLKRLGPAILQALEEKELLHARKQAEQKYQSIFENSMEGIFQSSPQGHYLSLNPAMARIYGYRSSKEMLESIQDIATQIYVEPEQRSEFMRLLSSQNSVEHFEAKNYCKDGSIIWTSTSARAVRDQHGTVLYYEGFSQDITQRKAAEEALQNSERRFRGLTKNGLDSISLLSVDGTLLWENPAAIRTLNYAPDEHIGRNVFSELMHPDDLEWTRELYAKVAQEPGSRHHRTFRLRHADGNWHWVEAIITNMLNEPGINAIVANYRDITEQKQAEIELQQRNTDLALINTLNEVINQGKDLDEIVDLLREGIKRNFSAEYTNIYLLDPDRPSIQMQHFALPPNVVRRIEKVLGHAIPTIDIPIQKDGFFQRVLQSGHAMVISGPEMMQSWMGEFTEMTSLSAIAKAAIRKLIPQFYRILNIESTVLVPLIADGKPLGLLNVSSSKLFVEQDLKRIENICGHLTTALRRKQVEDALHESQTRYKHLVETSHDLLWSVDAEMRYTFVNGASREIYGYEPQELIGRSLFEVLDPEHRAANLKTFKQTIATMDELRGLETHVRHHDGRQIILSTNSIVLRDEHGNITGVTGSSHDITLRKRVEDVLKEERNLLRTLIDNIPDRIYAMDMQGRKTLSNIADWRASGGKTMDDVIGKTDFDLYPLALAEEFGKLNRAVLDSGQPALNYEEPGLDADGNFVSILTSKIPLRDDQGKVVGLVGVGRDITERKQTEEMLRRSESRYRLATKATNDVIWEWDPKTHQLHWSENAQHVFGYPEKEIGPDEKWWDDHLHPEDRSRVLSKLDALLAGNESIWLEEYRLLLNNGSYAHIRDRGYVERDEHGSPLRMIGAMADITASKEAEIERQALLEIMQGLANTKDLQELLNLLHDSIAKVIYAENFFVVLHQESTGLFEEIYSIDQFDPPAPPSKLENSITSYVYRSGKPLLLNRASFDELVAEGEVKLIGTDSASWLGAPLKASDRTIGVMVVQDYEKDNRYSEHDKDFLASIATQVALVIERKHAEGLLRESEERFSSAFEYASIGMALVTTDGRWSRVNWALCWLLGYSEAELLQKTFQDITHPDDLETDLAYVHQLLGGEINSYQMEKRYFHKRGHVVWALLSVSLVENDQGTPQYFISQIQDITERKQVEESLRAEQKKAEQYLETAGVMMLALDREGAVTMINQKGCEILGYSADEIIGKNWINTFLPAANREELYNVFQQLIAEDIQAPKYYENHVLTKSGEERLIAWHNTVLRSEQGDIISTLSSGEDITERKRAEQEIRRRAEETSALLETSLALTNLDLEATLQTIGSSANSLFLADGCRIFLLEQDGETLRCVLALGENTDAFLNLRLKMGQGVTGAVAASGKAEIVNEMQNDPRALQVAGTEEEPEAIMFAPLKERDRAIGILSIRRLGEDRPFQQADLELLEAFAAMAASAVSKARLFEETQGRMAELRASEERFRQLADNIQEAFWMTDAETDRELYMSPAVETIWGRSIQSLMYEPNAWFNSVFSQDRPLLLDAVEREKSGEKVQLEYRIVRPDGTLRWIWDRAFPIVDDSGKVRRIAGIAADITERRESELALAKSQNRYRELFDSSPISIWEEDYSLVKKQIDALRKNGVIDLREYLASHPEFVRELASLVKITDVNNASLELYGSDRKEDLLHSLGELFDITTINHFVDEIIGLMGPLKRFSWEGADITPAGRRLEILVHGSIPYGYEEDWSKVIVSIIDVTERRQAEHELRKLSRAVEQSGSTIVITDTAGKIEYVNPKFTQITGYPFEEVIGQNPRILKSGFTADEDYKQLWETIRSGGEWHGELLNRKKDGTLFWESVTISPILNDRREITHYVGVKEDITQRKQSELEIHRHVAELEAVYENGLSVGRLLEPREIGNRVIETFARYLPWHHVTIRLCKEGSDDLELVSFNLPHLKEGERADAEQHFIARINKVGQGLSGWVIQTGRPLRTGNVHAHPQYIDTHAGIQSGLYMPLKVGERVIGVISVESETPNAFTEQDERLLATLANQTAIAFENSRLYEAMQKELLERKRMEEALRISETHYRALADSITDILFELDHNLHFTHWNKASEALTGIPAQDAIGKSLEEVWEKSEEQARIKLIYEDVLRRGQPKTFETTLVFSGEKRSFETTAYPSLRGVSVVAKDVTDRKQTEVIMQKRFELMEYSARHSLNELMLRTVDEVSELTGSAIGFFHFMEEDQIHLGMQTWSTNALQLFRVSSEDGSHLPVDRAGVWAEAVRQRRPLIHNDYEALANRRSLPVGHVPILREIVIPIIRNERIMAVMGIANKPQDYTPHDMEIATRLADYAWDITERKQMEIALQLERNQLVQRVEERTADLSRANSNLARALRVKDEFLANMSHELRTPLNAILGLSESLGEQIAGPLNQKQQKYISTISESGHHLLSLINDILDLAKIDAGQITLDINKMDIRSVCQASLRMIKQLAQKKNQEVALDIDPGLGLMWADERRLKQMIVNLLGNAVKFTPENGRLGLEVRGDEEANQITITVWDHGIGIKPEDLARLFQPFVQLDSGLAREATGTGLGLALVAQMARLHGGSVNAISEAGKGSRFTIVLPWEPALAIDTASRMKITGKFHAIQMDEKNKPTILLVEDTKEVVMMLKDYLELAGYKVFTAQDGIDGIVQARHVKPDLILMDVQMPGMDGFETTRKLRSDPNFRYTPIIALTALAMPHDRERCLEAGMDEYISKPVNLKALVKIIQSCLFEQGSYTR